MFGCVVDPEECDCSCHRDGGTHITACCDECRYCGKRIEVFYVESHEKECRMRPENLKRAQEELEKALKKLDEAQKISPELWKKRITI